MEQIDLIKKKLLLLEGHRANAHQAFHEATGAITVLNEILAALKKDREDELLKKEIENGSEKEEMDTISDSEIRCITPCC